MTRPDPIPRTAEPGIGAAPAATLTDWLTRIEALHPSEVELGLERLRRVAGRAGLLRIDVPLVIVAGTNGKGSTVAMLEAAWRACGYRTGACTSPHLNDFNERIRVNGEPLADAAIVAAFEAIEPHRAPDTLTYFEYATLAAVRAFADAAVDVVVLEVGLGGRLDAVNLWDADVAVLTSVALDHADWLGTDLGVIATEKAAVGRRGRPLVIGEPAPPAALAPFLAARGIVPVAIDPDAVPVLTGLPGAHQRRNAACALATLEALRERLPHDPRRALAGIAGTRVAARLERRTVAGVSVWLDVAHNPAGAAAVAEALADRGPVHLVFAALADKDIDGIARALAPLAASVACAALVAPRAGGVDALAEAMRAACGPGVPVEACGDVEAAWDAAAKRSRADGFPVLVAGSFVTVGALLRAWRRRGADRRGRSGGTGPLPGDAG